MKWNSINVCFQSITLNEYEYNFLFICVELKLIDNYDLHNFILYRMLNYAWRRIHLCRSFESFSKMLKFTKNRNISETAHFKHIPQNLWLNIGYSIKKNVWCLPLFWHLLYFEKNLECCPNSSQSVCFETESKNISGQAYRARRHRWNILYSIFQQKIENQNPKILIWIIPYYISLMKVDYSERNLYDMLVYFKIPKKRKSNRVTKALVGKTKRKKL